MKQLLKISISGVRGIVGRGLTPGVITDFAQSFGTYISHRSPVASRQSKTKTKDRRAKTGDRRLKIVVGRDTRPSGAMVKRAVFSGLLSTGCKVVDIGVCPTPSLLLMVRKVHAHGGIIITASHNPSPWNGLKFVSREGVFLDDKEMKKLISIYKTKKFNRVPWDGKKRVKTDNRAIETHIQKVLAKIDVGLIKKRRFRVAIDPCNGTGALITTRFLKKLGCRVVAINNQPNGIFNHNPEPRPNNLRELSSLVRAKHADIGFAQDPDADRLAIVSEEGKIPGEEYTLALAVKFVLGKRKDKVVVNLSTSRILEDIAREFGVSVIRTPIGEARVVERIRKENALIGGEGNGGVIFPRINCGRDSLVAMGLILEYMAKSGKPVSQLIGSLPRYKMLKRKVACPMDRVPALMKRLNLMFKDDKINTADGIRIDRGNAWVHIRPSNTEPVVRIISEAKTRQEAKHLIKLVLTKL